MASRRYFLEKLGQGSLIAPLLSSGLLQERSVNPVALPVGTPETIARDETYWHDIQQAFSVDRSIIHLNNGGVCPTPICVQHAAAEHQQYAYKVPFYVHRRNLKPQWERVRKGLLIHLAVMLKSGPDAQHV